MKRIFLLIACVGALLVSACGGDSKLPTATGTGAIRMINAIPGSPDVFFRIEELLLGEVAFQSSSSPATYDNLLYNFNFEIRYPDEAALTRVASQELQVEADRDHIFLLTGDINAPTVTIWNDDRREWAGNETVFEVRFSHASVALSNVDIDVYFDTAGTAPGTNPPIATLSYGEIADAVDFEEGDYVITVTEAGDLDAVHFTSNETSLLAQFAHVITMFDGDGNNTAPFVVSSMTSVGNPLAFPDPTYPPEIRFIHAGYTLETVDIYDDELLTSLVAEDLAFQAATLNLGTVTDPKIYYFTPANSQATILFDHATIVHPAGTYRHLYLFGDTDDWGAVRTVPDLASSTLSAKVSIFNAAFDFSTVDVYVKERDVPIAEDEDRTTFIVYGLLNSGIELAGGSYDIYLIEQGTKTEISAPFQIDVVIGDIVQLFAVNTVDPAVIELVNLPDL